ncbi:acyl-CoA carboxylase subunit beta [Halioglobus pacificus]|uniref:Acetyl-CoA carboxylase carboxyltransferase subunit n=1 Tax=Parahalioglobus pacificus TaxID=930806 RepID=A0A918XH04_9GAMM|nr:acyl-CoA carboxylase subunit beta [Halioglobus pacificus]NQY02846.1 acyl-CoA carboxylase subunit beta [Halieaceae bacterium]GHD31550.1 acetyl-CoA carboxylase carboxyltransferase subunit [Halioglobus pacificus]
MAVIDSQLDTQSDSYLTNFRVMSEAVNEIRDIEQRVIDAAQAKAPRYIKRGLIPPRERLGLLLDAGAPFLELSTLCSYKQAEDTDGTGAGGSYIAGIGYISGVRCVVAVDDYLTKGGSIGPYGGKKRQRMMDIAMENKLPMVNLSQSGGGNLKLAGDTFGESGAMFAKQCRLSAMGIPQITVVHGSATAGGAYQPTLSDYLIMVRRQSTMYLAGPPLLKAATGEIATDEELGGAEMHSEVAGTNDYLAENDADGIRLAREVTQKLGWKADSTVHSGSDFQPPIYPREQLRGIVPEDPKTPFDMREVIARIADASEFLEFKREFDQGTLCGHITLEGHTCGVIGNNSPITARGAAKAAQFIQLCEQSGTPLLFLTNTTGFLVGTEAEQAGIIKHGAKFIQAVTNCTVPKITLIVSGSYGAGNYAMAGRGMGPRFLFAWPRSVVSVMGPAQAGSVMRQVAEAKLARSGEVTDKMRASVDAMEKETVEAMEARSNALANTARGWDDGIIDPADTRAVVAFVLSVCREGDARDVNTNTFGVGRL